MRLRWLLLLNFVSILLFSSPARAGKLLFWDFEPDRNQLTFVTEEGVQPSAKLITNPSPNRLVIDLPGTNLGRRTINKSIGKAINSIRVGQFDNRTTRIVVELAPGYTIDPEKVKFKGISSTRWEVNLPDPQRISAAIAPDSVPIRREQSRSHHPPRNNSDRKFPRDLGVSRDNSRYDRPLSANTNPASAFEIRNNGLFVKIDGKNYQNKITTKRSQDGRRIDFYIEGVLLPAHFESDFIRVDRNYVEEIKFAREATSPPIARISLNVAPNSPDMRAYFSRLGGLIISPSPGRNSTARSPQQPLSRRQPDSSRRPPITRSSPRSAVPLVDSLELVSSNKREPQLLIKADRDIAATINKNSRLNIYEIVIPNAKLAETLKVKIDGRSLGLNGAFAEGKLPRNSPFSDLKIRERDDRSVEIIIKPALGVRIGQFNQVSNQMLALSMRQLVLSSSSPRPLIDRGFERPLPGSTSRPKYSNRRANQKVLVTIDPGHGGKDPGAIGIGGLREKDIVLPISLMVRQFLEAEGVKVKMTRQSDYYVSLAGRTQMANRQGADLFVSIHANAINMRRQDVSGLETYYYHSGRRLAQTIHSNVLRKINIRDRKVRKARFYVLRKSAMPAVLVEVGFVTGREDAPKLRSPQYRRQVARAIADGILEYISRN